MAVTAQDQKYLNPQGVAALQQATDAWAKANAAGDTAGMLAAQEQARGIRVGNQYLNQPGTGYTTHMDGTYLGPAATPAASAVTQQSVAPATNQGYDPNIDYSTEIISMLTGGGKIDYGRLNSLVAARDAKYNSNIDLYGQFDDTQTLLNRYLPLAQENERLARELEEKNKKASSTTSEVDTIANLLQSLISGPNNYMSFDEARARAESELNPMYGQAFDKLRQGVNMDMEQRGIFNSPLASGIMAEKQGALTADQLSAVASRANQLIQDDRSLTLQEKELKTSALNNLLSSLIGRETSIAELTGVYGGNPTLAAQQLAAQAAISEGQLTGMYKGQPTLQSQQLSMEQLNSSINNALSQIQVLGKVTTAEQAELLGVPVGTPSFQAQQAAAQLQASIAASWRNSQQTDLSDLNKDLAIWEQTGRSPDTPALKYYGISPGTPWSQSAGEQLEEIVAQQQLDEIQEVQKFASAYGINTATAEAALALIQGSTNLQSALANADTNSAALAAEGVNVSVLKSVLNKHYSSKYVAQALGSSPGLSTQTQNNQEDLRPVTPKTQAWLDRVSPNSDFYQGSGYFDKYKPQWWVKVNGKWYEDWGLKGGN